MTQSVYVVGGAGAGKSTFMQAMLDQVESFWMGPLTDLHTKANAKGTPVTLRGHRLSGDGLYLGCMRDWFPGTDGLDRASSLPGEEWLVHGGAEAYKYIVSEGATLSSRRFLTALHRHTNLLLVHLHVDPMIADLRFLQRGTTQAESFVQITVTRSANVAADMRKLGVQVLSVDTEHEDAWQGALEEVRTHLQQGVAYSASV